MIFERQAGVRNRITAVGACLIVLLCGCAGRTGAEDSGSFRDDGGDFVLSRAERDENRPGNGTEETVPLPRGIATCLLPELVWEMGGELKPSDFFDPVALETAFGLTEDDLDALEFETEPDEGMLHTAGKYEVRIRAGKQVLLAHLTVQDTTPPVITAPEPAAYHIGDAISYKKGVSVSDNSGEQLLPEIDNSNVLTNMAGTYYVYYAATDSSGNTGRAVAKITILPEHEATEEEVQALAADVLDSILTEGMSQYEQAEAIYDWCHGNIMSAMNADKSSVLQGAYDGLFHRKGDCYTFYAAASWLLTACGIDNIGVSRAGGTATHYWSLVNTGSGWYHFDCSPHAGGYKCFMQTDAQVRAYSAQHRATEKYYEFDEPDMPQRETEILYGD